MPALSMPALSLGVRAGGAGALGQFGGEGDRLGHVAVQGGRLDSAAGDVDQTLLRRSMRCSGPWRIRTLWIRLYGTMASRRVSSLVPRVECGPPNWLA